MRIVFAFFSTLALLAGCNSAHQASVNLEGGVRVSLTVNGMFSLQSDWRRTLTVGHRGEKISRELFEDTGWWRGSNLYLAEAGLFVLDEGQTGCIAFRLDPMRFDDKAARCHQRRQMLTNEETSERDDNTVSFVYPGMRYLGRFAETTDGRARVEFISAGEAPEIKLPDPL